MRSALAALAMVVGVSGTAALMSTTLKPEKVLASYVTSFTGRMKDQTHNAVLAAKRLDGMIVEPGQVLSFNASVGTWSRDQGYRKAPVSFSGTLVDTWGGGVCQTSTTLYNACLLAGMEVVERHHHQFAANYVPPGRDAAVAFPNIDLKMRNNFAFRLRVKARVSADRLVVEILGSGDVPNVSVSQNILQTKPVGKFFLGKGPVARVRNPGKAGYQVEVFRTVGNQRELVSSDSYPAMSRVVEYRPRGQ